VAFRIAGSTCLDFQYHAVMQPISDLVTDTDIAERLRRDLFGFDQYRGRQQAAIEATLAGRDTVVLMPTGGGKSLCYQIPALVREGVGLVISPLIALMHDQVRALQALGIEAAYLNSSLNSGEQQAVMERLRTRKLKLLYIAPRILGMRQCTIDRLVVPWMIACETLEAYPAHIGRALQIG
jgi:superfamily II DNA helicase RecQ